MPQQRHESFIADPELDLGGTPPMHDAPVAHDLPTDTTDDEVAIVAALAVGLCLGRAGVRLPDLETIAPEILEAVHRSRREPWVVVEFDGGTDADRVPTLRVDRDERGIRVQVSRVLKPSTSHDRADR